ncbi:2-oxopent-4-enoate hydratase [Pseudomonas sp. R5(2019)]|uniref:2-oxopent-4-enoate hydratase n=1 Tax=Pseudomonas sp. R5(2019) TaxID=2697566 RepID=UPI0014120C62|nr:2-oxopent-4-enoate hydratase [Pseudomonas sp. R5(2019)]NBA93652.1 2-oxopent-4-enoate hydratase [Pseudomonas sp. R5(2019)]
MNQHDIQIIGQQLHKALCAREALAPLTDTHPDMTLEQAYQIQLAMIQQRLDNGESVIGKKIGVTSKVVMDMLGVDQPDFGHLLSDMLYADGAAIAIDGLIAPKAEGEIAFVLKDDLRGPGVTVADVLRATDYVMPCFEIVDSRIRDWKIRIQDTVADNASAGAFVLGGQGVAPRDVDLACVGMTLEKNGEVVATGAGAAALGHPANAVAWLANKLGELGIGLNKGEVILSGSLAAMVPVKPGDQLRISLGGIGSAAVRFV